MDNLCRRELQVLTLLANGYEAKEIARELSISFYTIKNYKRLILLKLQALNTSHAIAIAFKKNILSKENILEGKD